jgi:hypothetical protein
MKNKLLIALCIASNCIHFSNGMNFIKNNTPPIIINPNKLSKSQREEVTKVYHSYLQECYHKSSNQAVLYGIPSVFAAVSMYSYVTILMMTGRSPNRTFALRRLSASAFTATFGISSVYHVANVIYNNYKFQQASSLKYLNHDLYKQLGKPYVESHDQSSQWMRVYNYLPHYSPQALVTKAIDFTNEKKLSKALNGAYLSHTIKVPQEYGQKN